MNAILGLDPSANCSGYALGEKKDIYLMGTIVPKKNLSEQEKLDYIYNNVKKLCIEHRPRIAVIEDQFVGKNPQISLYLARVRGVYMLACQHAGIPVHLFTPSQIKKAMTGKGNASKKLVQEKAVEVYGLKGKGIFKDGIIKTGKKKNDDISDALAAIYTYDTKVMEQPA